MSDEITPGHGDQEDDFPTLLEDIREYYQSDNLIDLMVKARTLVHHDVLPVLAARLALEEARRLGSDGQIYDYHLETDSPTDPRSAHTFLVLDGMKEDDYPLNLPMSFAGGPIIDSPTIQEVRANGLNVTEEVLQTPWHKLLK